MIMETGKKITGVVKIAICLLAFAGGAFADIVFSDNITPNGQNYKKFTMENKTFAPWALGGLRYKGVQWTAARGIIQREGGTKLENLPFYPPNNFTAPNLVQIYSTKDDGEPLLQLETITINESLSGWGGAVKAPTTGAEILLKTTKFNSGGGNNTGVNTNNPDELRDAAPISISELKSLQSKKEFYDRDYRYKDSKGNPYHDSLGTFGGIAGGGRLDTYFGQTQIHFAYPKSGFQIIKPNENGFPQHLYLSLALAQEYFTTDAQLMFALAADETKYGVENMNINDLEKKMGTTTAIGGGITGPIPIEYGAWRVKASTSGLEGAFGTNTQIYQYYFKRRRNVMYQSESRAKYLNYLSAFQLTLQGAPANYYMRGWSDFNTQDEEKNAVLNNLPQNRLPSIHTAAISNQMFTAIIMLMASNSFFDQIKKDFANSSKNVCWYNALEVMKDEYFAVAALIDLYKRAETVDVGNGIKDIAAMLSGSNFKTTVSDPQASGKFPKATPAIEIIKKLVAASKNFEKEKGTTSDIIDFEVDKKMLLELFFGDGGTPEKQGKGGILLHFADQRRLEWDAEYSFSFEGENMKIDYMPMRKRIWNTLSDAFDICAGKAPNAAGTGKVGNDKISYRYDLLSILRTVKVNFPFTTYTLTTLAAGMHAALTAIPENKSPCDEPIIPPVPLDNIYPYIDTAYQESMSGDSCVIIVKMRDVHSAPVKGKVRRVLGTPDFFWVEWTPAVMTSANKDTSEATFRLALSRDEADRLNSESAAGGRFVWIMAEDAGGNSVIRKLPIEVKRAKSDKPQIKWAGVFDTPTGDGLPDHIKAEITPNGFKDLKQAEYSFKWKSDSIVIKAGDVSVSGNIVTLKFSPNLNEGFGSGKFYMYYDSLNEDGKKTGNMIKDSIDLSDSCGPAISSAEFNPYPVNDTKKPDTLRLKFTEPIKGATNGKVLILFKKGKGTPQSFTVENVKGSGDSWEFLYKSGNIAPNRVLAYDSVKIKFDTGITDEVGNAPLDDNKWVKITDLTVTKKPIDIKIKKAEYFDTSNPADGFIDEIRVEFDFGKSGDYGKYKSEFQKMFAKDRVVSALSKTDRHFTVEKVEFNDERSFTIKVSQDKEKFKLDKWSMNYYSPKTDVDDKKDVLSFSGAVNINDSLEIPAPEEFKIVDKVAPVITIAYYSYGNGSEIDTLVVEFSEEVNGGDIEKLSRDVFNVISPRNNDNIYSPKFVGSEHPGWDGDNKSAKFIIEYNEYDDGNEFIVPGDSIQIVGVGRGIFDNSGNSQEGGMNTVFAPIAVGALHSDYEIKIFPNPYNNSSPQINEAVYHYSGESVTKLAIIVSPLTKRAGSKVIESSSVTIIDQLGNVVASESGQALKEYNGVWIWTWDGKNTKKRAVGAGTYMAIISIDGEKLPPRKIGIKN